MNPYETWRRNKGRVDLRAFTRKFQENFKGRRICESELSGVYSIVYMMDPNLPTDKHHATPVMLSFGRFVGDDGSTYVRGANLLYLKTDEAIDLMMDVHRIMDLKLEARVAPLIAIHEKYMQRFPQAFKNYEERRILSCVRVKGEDWGMVPLLHKHLMGNFNPTALLESYNLENKRKPVVIRRKLKEEKPAEEIEQVEEVFTEGFVDTSFDE
jgi:hypothetical protein